MTSSRGNGHGRIILLIGGARSGKSRYAQELAGRLGDRVLYVATAEALDGEMKQRIEAHRAARPSSWRTLEAPRDVGRAIEEHLGNAEVVTVDCVTFLVGNLLGGRIGQGDDWEVDPDSLMTQTTEEIEQLLACAKRSNAAFILVTNEVGGGVVPDNQPSRVYRDLLGEANRLLASGADEVYLMVAGIPSRIKGPEPGGAAAL